jgi:transposase InsO family protein
MGWSLDDNMKVSMVKEALTMANGNRIYKHENVIHHSDRGRQYAVRGMPALQRKWVL